MTVVNSSEAKEQAEHLDSIIYSKSPSDDEMIKYLFHFFRLLILWISELRYYWEKNISDDSFRFNYAVALSHSNNEFQRRESLHHFESLINNNLYQKDSLYNMATTHYSLGDFESARLCCEELYRQEPDNRQVSLFF